MSSVSPVELPPVPPNIAEITSPLIFGILISWGLYGILTTQVFLYYTFFKDKGIYKVLIYVVFFLDTVQTILMGVDMWYWFGQGFGNVIQLSKPFISAFDAPILGAVISIVIQFFFCYRIYILSSSWWLPSIIGAISCMQTVAAIISGARGLIVNNFAIARAHIDLVSLYVWLIGSAVADTMIAASMTYLLLSSKTREHSRTSNMLNSIIRLTIETNALSSSLAIISLVFYFTLPSKSYFICPTFFLGKIYSNTLLLTFNNRFFITRDINPVPTWSFNSGKDVRPSHPGRVLVGRSPTSYKIQNLSGTETTTLNETHGDSRLELQERPLNDTTSIGRDREMKEGEKRF